MSVIAVVSTSGNVGKTFLSREVIYEFFPCDKTRAIIEVETINTSTTDLNYSGLNVRRFSGKEISDIYRETMFHDNTVIDVGASNFAPFIEGIRRIPEFAGDIDLFVVPVSLESGKHISDALVTIRTLRELGLHDKIWVVFNNVNGDIGSGAGGEFLKALREMGISYREDSKISRHEIVGLLETIGKTSKDYAEDETDYKNIAKMFSKKKDFEKAKQASEQHIAKIGATSLKDEAINTYNLIVHEIHARGGGDEICPYTEEKGASSAFSGGETLSDESLPAQ